MSVLHVPGNVGSVCDRAAAWRSQHKYLGFGEQSYVILYMWHYSFCESSFWLYWSLVKTKYMAMSQKVMQWSHKSGHTSSTSSSSGSDTYETGLRVTSELHKQVAQIPRAPVPSTATPISQPMPVTSWGVLCDQLSEEEDLGAVLPRRLPNPAGNLITWDRFHHGRDSTFFSVEKPVAVDTELPFLFQRFW